MLSSRIVQICIKNDFLISVIIKQRIYQHTQNDSSDSFFLFGMIASFYTDLGNVVTLIIVIAFAYGNTVQLNNMSGCCIVAVI